MIAKAISIKSTAGKVIRPRQSNLAREICGNVTEPLEHNLAAHSSLRGDSKLEDVRPTLVQDSLRKLTGGFPKVQRPKELRLVLKKWQELCTATEQRWLFPSPATGRPYRADSIRADYQVPAGVKLGLGRIGFHSFRHTYRVWLDETGAPMGDNRS